MIKNKINIKIKFYIFFFFLEDKISIEARCSLSGVAKIMNNLVCGIKPEEEMFELLKEFIESSKERIKKLLDQISSRKSCTTNTIERPSRSSSFREYFVELYESFLQYLPEIKQIFQSKFESLPETDKILPVLENISNFQNNSHKFLSSLPKGNDKENITFPSRNRSSTLTHGNFLFFFLISFFFLIFFFFYLFLFILKF